MATINGTSGNDTLNGTSGDDTLNGLGGNDELVGSAGNDFYDGGAGNSDTLNLRGAATPVVVDFAAGTISGGFTGTFVNMERVLSSNGNDHLIGTAGAQNLSGLAGNDTLEGGAGNDWLWGGGGNDSFVFRETGTANADQMGDFTSGADRIVLDATVMTALGAEGNFSAGDARFFAGAGATAGHDADDRIVYNTTTHQLFYDPDGSGSASAQLLATLQNSTALAATDIVVQGAGTPPGVINGTAGDDTLTGTSGNDTINGLGGNDSISGLAGDDSLSGGDGNDSILGGAGFDTLRGDAGNDTLSGAAGVDSLFGGAGADQFILDQLGTADADGINDFATGLDKLVVDGAVMTAIGASGPFAAGDERFFAGPGATTGHDATDRIIYDTTGQHLWYDPDGSGPAASQFIGAFSSPVSLAATDFIVINGTTPPGAINGTAGNDTLTGTPGNDTINGLGGNDSISGLEGDDSISGGDGNDTMDGGPGTDTLDGGLGDDTYVFNDGAPGTIVDAGGADTVVVTDNDGVLVWDLQPDLENLTLRGSSFFVVGEGNELDNVLRNEGTRASEGYLDGADGNDTLIGGPYFLFQAGSGDYGHDFVDGAGDHGTMFVGDRSAAVVDFRNGTVVGGGVSGTGSIDFVDIRQVVGADFNDQFFASDSGNRAHGGAGDDTFVGGAGNDTFSDDGTLSYDGADINGIDVGNDDLFGGGGNDLIAENRGDDFVDAGEGNDTIDIDIGFYLAGDSYTYGNDTIDGGNGIDTLSVILLTGVSVDLGAGTMTGGGAGGSGRALLTSIENFDTSRGGTGGDNVIIGSAAANVLIGFGSHDTLNGAGGNDTLTGGGNADAFVFDQAPGAANADHITDLASGNDKIDLDATVMTALGTSGSFAAGDARFFAAAGATAGHDADDRVVYDTTSGNLWYDADGNGAGAAQLIARLDGAPALAATDIVVLNGSGGGGTPGEVINGTSGNDTLTGTAGNDTLNGLGGNDELVGSAGNDFFDGGSGNNDTLNFRLTSTPTTVDFGAGTVSGGFTGTFVNMERVLSGLGDDSLIGTTGAQNLSGRAGNDTLEGGAGNDWLWGGGGDDTFIFREAGTANADRMGDFSSGLDTIALDNATLTALGAEGDLASGDGRFFAAAGANGGHDADDRLVYNTSTGQLWYDDDGSGAHAAQLVATLTNLASLAATDITVL